MTKNTVQRLAVFFIGIPLFVIVTIFIGFGRHFVLALLVLALMYLMLGEATAMFKAVKLSPRMPLVGVLSLALGLSAYLLPMAKDLLPYPFSPLAALLSLSVLGALAIAGSFAFARKEEFPDILPSFAASLSVYFYCGILGSFLMHIVSGFDLGTEAVLCFTLLTFGNDSLAWLTGMTLGRKRDIIPVSPNKSVAGFVGGFLGSIVAAGLSLVLFPHLQRTAGLGIYILGFFIGITVIVGDLLESALKRSAGIKDSSTLVPGRGGILDSFDSLLFSAPVFVFVASLLGLFDA
ncbi:MAG TPA: phosphatidate cytidylyltransferase [Rectinemataceae bacterium]